MTGIHNKPSLIESPRLSPCTFLDLPLTRDLDNYQVDIAILGISFGMPYESNFMANEQSRELMQSANLQLNFES